MGTCRVISLIVIAFGLAASPARAQEGTSEGEQRVLADVKDAKGRPWSEAQLRRDAAWQYRHFYGAV